MPNAKCCLLLCGTSLSSLHNSHVTPYTIHHTPYNTPRRKDLYETCGDDWSECSCAGAERRIGNGSIDCTTAVCPNNCDVCVLCLMEFNDIYCGAA